MTATTDRLRGEAMSALVPNTALRFAAGGVASTIVSASPPATLALVTAASAGGPGASPPSSGGRPPAKASFRKGRRWPRAHRLRASRRKALGARRSTGLSGGTITEIVSGDLSRRRSGHHRGTTSIAGKPVSPAAPAAVRRAWGACSDERAAHPAWRTSTRSTRAATWRCAPSAASRSTSSPASSWPSWARRARAESTLMNLLGCLDRPSSGSYVLAGARGRAHGPERARGGAQRGPRLRVPELQPARAPRRSRTSSSRSSIAASARAQRPEKAKGRFERVGLGSAWTTPAQLSGGQQQRVAIARALVGDPEGHPRGRADRQPRLADEHRRDVALPGAQESGDHDRPRHPRAPTSRSTPRASSS